MKHPVRNRILILVYALCTLCVAAGAVALAFGKIPYQQAAALLAGALSVMTVKKQIVLTAVAVVLALASLLLISVTLPSKKKRSSSFAIQQNENGMVRISLKALDALVQKCLGQHAELKVVSSSLYSDEESIRVDVHISLQADISMPLAISALQKQIKKYLEACSGVVVQEVRVFVDGTLPSDTETMNSPFAIPPSMLGFQEALPVGNQDEPVSVEAASEDRNDDLEQAADDEESASDDEPFEEEEQALEEELPLKEMQPMEDEMSSDEQGEVE